MATWIHCSAGSPPHLCKLAIYGEIRKTGKAKPCIVERVVVIEVSSVRHASYIRLSCLVINAAALVTLHTDGSHNSGEDQTTETENGFNERRRKTGTFGFPASIFEDMSFAIRAHSYDDREAACLTALAQDVVRL